ncbi:MAG: DNA polymerase III subunit delta' [Pseudomonadota bacterium]|nr:DNA polymerase III subunit delta' [Pseudomonadota bacterium]MDP1904671.1 DNA polymerase III subunit delta' [Pseudomonadota bacterium]MDP2352862.1 DNA polymerase III subunit delta' [Pseudomonadota bacterium]
MIHPWNADLFRQLGADPEHMPHAILLHGPAGVGKLELAIELARWSLCEQPSGEGACGVCDACNWFDQGNHPDFRRVEPVEVEAEDADAAPAKKAPKKGSRVIKVEAIREISDFLSLSAHRGGWRVALIHPAEFMNAAAANALLKTLEEPPARVLLLLVSHQPRRLLPTVISRCRKVAVPLPQRARALAWLAAAGMADPESPLAEAGGAPLAALAYAEPERAARREAFLDLLARPRQLDACQAAQTFQPVLAEAWGWLARWVHDLLAQRLAGQSHYFPGREGSVVPIAATCALIDLLAFQRELAQAGRWLRHPLNAQLLLESWLIRYSEIAGARP